MEKISKLEFLSIITGEKINEKKYSHFYGSNYDEPNYRTISLKNIYIDDYIVITKELTFNHLIYIYDSFIRSIRFEGGCLKERIIFGSCIINEISVRNTEINQLIIKGEKHWDRTNDKGIINKTYISRLILCNEQQTIQNIEISDTCINRFDIWNTIHKGYFNLKNVIMPSINIDNFFNEGKLGFFNVNMPIKGLTIDYDFQNIESYFDSSYLFDKDKADDTKNKIYEVEKGYESGVFIRNSNLGKADFFSFNAFLFRLYEL